MSEDDQILESLKATEQLVRSAFSSTPVLEAIKTPRHYFQLIRAAAAGGLDWYNIQQVRSLHTAIIGKPVEKLNNFRKSKIEPATKKLSEDIREVERIVASVLRPHGTNLEQIFLSFDTESWDWLGFFNGECTEELTYLWVDPQSFSSVNEQVVYEAIPLLRELESRRAELRNQDAQIDAHISTLQQYGENLTAHLEGLTKLYRLRELKNAHSLPLSIEFQQQAIHLNEFTQELGTFMNEINDSLKSREAAEREMRSCLSQIKAIGSRS